MIENTSKTTQELADDFHAMIGYCIAEWAVVDNELFRIFRSCLGPYDQSAILYYRTPGLDARFKTTDELVLSVLPEPDRPKEKGGHDHPSVIAWKKATQGHGELLGVRRRIAHQPLRLIRQNSSAYFQALLRGNANEQILNENPASSWFEIYVSQHEGLRSKAAKLVPLTIEDLGRHFMSVSVLAGRLSTFYNEILTKPPKEPAARGSPQ